MSMQMYNGLLAFLSIICACILFAIIAACAIAAYEKAWRWLERRAIRRRLQRFDSRVGRSVYSDVKGVWK